MKKQINYNFSRLLGETTHNKLSLQESLNPSRHQSKDKAGTNEVRTTHRQLRPVGIIRVKRDQSSCSRSSLQSTSSKQSLKLGYNTYRSSRVKNAREDVTQADQFFNRFDSEFEVKYRAVTYSTASVKRRLLGEFEKEGGQRARPVHQNNFVGDTFAAALKESRGMSGKHSLSRQSLASSKSQHKLSLRQIQTRYKESQQKILKLRQKVNDLYRLNTESSQKEFKSIVLRQSRPKKHKLLY